MNSLIGGQNIKNHRYYGLQLKKQYHPTRQKEKDVLNFLISWFMYHSNGMDSNGKEELAYQIIYRMKLPSNIIKKFILYVSNELILDGGGKQLYDPCTHLPFEICVEIFSRIDNPSDLVSCSLVSKRWHKLISNSFVWRKAYFNYNSDGNWKFNIWHELQTKLLANPKMTLNWYLIYKIRYQLKRNWLQGGCLKYTYSKKTDPDSHADSIYTIQLDNKRQLMFTGSRDRTVKSWDLVTGRCIKTLSHHQASVLCLAVDLDRDGLVVSGSSDNTIAIWDYNTGQIKTVLNGHMDSVVNVKLYRDKYIISCSKDSTIRIWDVNAFQLVRTLRGHKGAINSVQPAPPESAYPHHIASASGDKTVKIWDVESGECIKTFIGHRHGVACLYFDGNTIISGSSDRTIHVFDLIKSQWVTTIYDAHEGLVRTLSLNSDDILVSGSYDETIKLWKRKTSDFNLPIDSSNNRTTNTNTNTGRPCIAYINESLPAEHQQSWELLYQFRSTHHEEPKLGKLYNIAANARYLIACSQDSTIICFDFGANIEYIDTVSKFY